MPAIRARHSQPAGTGAVASHRSDLPVPPISQPLILVGLPTDVAVGRFFDRPVEMLRHRPEWQLRGDLPCWVSLVCVYVGWLTGNASTDPTRDSSMHRCADELYPLITKT
jgi:hypothetical protein